MDLGAPPGARHLQRGRRHLQLRHAGRRPVRRQQQRLGADRAGAQRQLRRGNQGHAEPAAGGLLLQLRAGRPGDLRRRRQLHQAGIGFYLGDTTDGIRQGTQPGAGRLPALRQYRGRAAG